MFRDLFKRAEEASNVTEELTVQIAESTLHITGPLQLTGPVLQLVGPPLISFRKKKVVGEHRKVTSVTSEHRMRCFLWAV